MEFDGNFMVSHKIFVVDFVISNTFCVAYIVLWLSFFKRGPFVIEYAECVLVYPKNYFIAINIVVILYILAIEDISQLENVSYFRCNIDCLTYRQLGETFVIVSTIDWPV